MAKEKKEKKENLEEEKIQTEETSETSETAEAAEAAEAAEEPTEDKASDAETKVKEWEDKYMRLYAEYDNFQKRSKREKDARYADAVVDVVAEILPVADNLERALAVEVEGDEAKKVLEGVRMVKKQMDDILAKLEVSEIAAVGEEFDPNVHNAVMHVEDENITDNTVVEEFMKGYRYKGDRVIRHSMVKVAN